MAARKNNAARKAPAPAPVRRTKAQKAVDRALEIAAKRKATTPRAAVAAKATKEPVKRSPAKVPPKDSREQIFADLYEKNISLETAETRLAKLGSKTIRQNDADLHAALLKTK